MKMRSFLIAVVLWALLLSAVTAAPPVLVRSEPADGEKERNDSVSAMQSNDALSSQPGPVSGRSAAEGFQRRHRW
jgi:hypothetical protein